MQAIEAFRSDLRLTPAQFKDRKGLLDLVVAYHILPGWRGEGGASAQLCIGAGGLP
jgi:hypothetical protein